MRCLTFRICLRRRGEKREGEGRGGEKMEGEKMEGKKRGGKRRGREEEGKEEERKAAVSSEVTTCSHVSMSMVLIPSSRALCTSWRWP